MQLLTNQERARRAKGFLLATLLRHCKARLTVIVFVSASAPRLASTFYLSYAFCFPNRCFQVQCKVFCKLVNFCKYSMFCIFTGALTLSGITT